MQPYDDALAYILKHGKKKEDRTGVGTIAVAGLSNTYDLDKGAFPLLTKRKMFPKSVFAELLWFLSGSTMNQDLEALGAKFWGKWCDENNPKYVALRQKYGYDSGDFGPIYGFQLRNFGADYITIRNLKKRREEILDSTVSSEEEVVQKYDQMRELQSEYKKKRGFDQLAYMMDKLQNDPFNRRILFSLWNPAQLDMMALPPCHYTYQVVVEGDGRISGIMTQRSCDFPVGVPANIQFYSALTIMFAQQCGREAATFVHNTSDSHIYLNQIEQVEEYLSRPEIASPQVKINKADDIYSYQMSDFVVENYNPGLKIDMPVAV
jgi:thymidylate synthase